MNHRGKDRCKKTTATRNTYTSRNYTQSVLEAGRTSKESLLIMGWVGVMAKEISHKDAMLELDAKAV